MTWKDYLAMVKSLEHNDWRMTEFQEGECCDQLMFTQILGDAVGKLKGHLVYGRPYDGLSVWQQLMSAMELVEDKSTLSKRFKNKSVRRAHALLGLINEIGELAEKYVKECIGEEVSKEDNVEECGDLLFYFTMLVDSFGVTLEDVMRANHAKLKKVRYKDGFSKEAANHRHTTAELESIKESLQNE